MSEIRLDKWLWAVRIYKTRTDAADACRASRVLVNGDDAKSSRKIKPGDVVSVKKMPVTYSFRVLELLSNRRPAKEIPAYAENITPREELEKLNMPRETVFVSRDRGAGRPTKKERREMEAVMEEFL